MIPSAISQKNLIFLQFNSEIFLIFLYKIMAYVNNTPPVNQMTVDDWAANLFGYPDKSHFFSESKKRSEARITTFLTPESEGGQGPCIKCKSLNTTAIKKQTRSADEGMSTIMKCGNCNAEWYSG
jgi:hypothetical protein